MAHSQETKDKISAGRKEWLAKNPDKHPWKSSEKFKSVPCEKVKQFLKDRDIPFIEEFSPDVAGRHFSVDIAFPDRRIIWEINGSQHYERNGLLKPYYQDRHDLLVADGWVVYEIPYACCFKQEKIDEFFQLMTESEVKIEFDYFNYVPRLAKETYCKDNCPKCSGLKEKKASLCLSCYEITPKPGSEKWPTVDEMRILVFQMPATELGRLIGVSDSMITKFCRVNNIEKPNRGYWGKYKSKNK